MRRSKAEKEQSREDIIDAAARLYRERGIATTSVSDVMAAAGLTHGGFYRHFGSKEDLAVAAIRKAFDSGLRVFSDAPEDAAAEARAYVEQYLSEAHVTAPGDGCPILHMGPEAARGPEAWQTTLTEGAEQAITLLARGLPGGRQAAIQLLSGLIGTLLLARAVPAGPLRTEILHQGRRTADALLTG